jgi:hypothetical protein
MQRCRVVDTLLQSLREDGVLDELWKKYSRPPTQSASSKAKEDDDGDESTPLQLVTVGGL